MVILLVHAIFIGLILYEFFGDHTPTQEVIPPHDFHLM